MHKEKSAKEGELEVLKKQLVNTISHTVRTPLSIVKEGLSLLWDEIPGKLNPKQKRIVRLAKANVDRLTQSLNEILQTPSSSGNKITQKDMDKISAQPGNKR